MNANDYIKNCLKTESLNSDQRINPNFLRILHGSLGLVTESAELQDTLKKHLFYGKILDRVNLKEEIGDVLWYCSILLDALDTNYEEVMERNIEKLKARYGEKFSEEKAINRNLDVEREILEK